MLRSILAITAALATTALLFEMTDPRRRRALAAPTLDDDLVGLEVDPDAAPLETAPAPRPRARKKPPTPASTELH